MFPGQPTDIREVCAASWRECVPLNCYTSTVAPVLLTSSPSSISRHHELRKFHLEKKIITVGWFYLKNKDHQLWIIPSKDVLLQLPIHMLSSDGNWSTLPEWRSWTKNIISILFPHIVITYKSLQRVCHTFSQKLLSDISNTDQFPVSSLTVQIWSVTSDICQVSLSKLWFH